MLLVSPSPEGVKKPFTFKTTNINVYSLEEAMYHAFHDWKSSIEDIFSNEFSKWVEEELKLFYISSKIKSSKSNTLSNRLMDFLKTIDYFSENELETMKAEIVSWENRLEWEKLKEHADFLLSKNQPSKAYSYYIKALQVEKNQVLYNNLGIALLKMEYYNKAEASFKSAYELDEKNEDILFNLMEATIYNENYNDAKTLLNNYMEHHESKDAYFYYGELYRLSGDDKNAVDFYEKSIKLGDDLHSYLRLFDIYMKHSQLDYAKKILEFVPLQNQNTVEYIVKLAELHQTSHNMSAAIGCIEKALTDERDSLTLWIHLARLHRLSYDYQKATSAITKALEINNLDDEARLEYALIKKSQGKIKDYQAVLKSIVHGVKSFYRDVTTI